MNSCPPLEPEQAWLLWGKLTQCADELWQAYPEAFFKRCLEQSRPITHSNDPIAWDEDSPF